MLNNIANTLGSVKKYMQLAKEQALKKSDEEIELVKCHHCGVNNKLDEHDLVAIKERGYNDIHGELSSIARCGICCTDLCM